MNDIRRELEQELKHTVDRLKGLGGAIAFEDDPGAREDEGQGEEESITIRLLETSHPGTVCWEKERELEFLHFCRARGFPIT